MTEKPFREIGEKLVSSQHHTWEKETFDRLYRMIDYGIKRQDWYEDQRNKALSLAIALLGLSSFLVAGLLSPETKAMLWFRIFGGFTLISIASMALVIIGEYAKGATESYTHRSLADIRSWFFAYVVSNEVMMAARRNKDRDHENKETLTKAWESFVSRWMEVARLLEPFLFRL